MLADQNRYIPKRYSLTKVVSDRNGLVDYTLVDSDGSTIAINGPQMYSDIPRPTTGKPCLISPSRLSLLPNSNMLFLLEYSTDYDIYWDGYPRKRFIPPREKETAQTSESKSMEAECSPEAPVEIE
jgi:hypothetical protein